MEYPSTTTGLLPTLWNKLVSYIEDHSLKQLAVTLGLFFLAGLLSAAFIDTEATMQQLDTLFAWKNLALPKIVFTFAVVFRGKTVYDALVEYIVSLVEREEGSEETIEGIPAPELLDHLFTEKSLKRDDVKHLFGVPQYRVEALGKKLQELGVLVTGPNNAKVLNPEFSRQDVAAIFRGKSSASELTPLFRRRDDHFTSDPSAKEIADRLSSALSQAPSFTIRPLTPAA